MSLRIGLWTNAIFTHTGYGIQGRHQTRIWRELGHEVANFANSGLSTTAIRWDGVPIYPVKREPFGFDVLRHYLDHFEADVLVTLYDHWRFGPGFRQHVETPWIAQTPIDAQPIPESLLTTLRAADYVVTYSEFGHDALLDARLPSTYIQHCVDADLFTPIEDGQAKARERLGFDQDQFVAVMVGMNKDRLPSRKSWPEVLQAWRIFIQGRPDAILYCHTTKKPYLKSDEEIGLNLTPLIKALEIPRDQVAFPHEQSMAVGFQDADMADIYRAADVVLLPSMAEGFGLPVIEAQACGVPVITIDAHTGPELTHDGWITRSLRPFWISGRNQWWAQADVAEIEKALRESYKRRTMLSPDKRAEQGRQTAKWVHDRYSIEAVTPIWAKFLDRVEAELW